MILNMNDQSEVQLTDDPLRVPFWIVLAGVGVGAAWVLMGVLAVCG
jgi:hypothetical protein